MVNFLPEHVLEWRIRVQWILLFTSCNLQWMKTLALTTIVYEPAFVF